MHSVVVLGINNLSKRTGENNIRIARTKQQHTDYTHKAVHNLHAATKQHLHILSTFYTLYFPTHQQSHQHFNLLLSFTFNFQ
jgi:hypothetical protein